MKNNHFYRITPAKVNGTDMDRSRLNLYMNTSDGEADSRLWNDTFWTFYFNQYPNTHSLRLSIPTSNAQYWEPFVSVGNVDNKFRSELVPTDIFANSSLLKFNPDVDLHATLSNFEYMRPNPDQLANKTHKVSLIDSYDIVNTSPGEVTRTVTLRKKITQEFLYTNSLETKAFGHITTTTKGGEPPAEMEIGTESGGDITIVMNHGNTKSTEKTFDLSYTVTVPPNSSVTISAWYERIQGIAVNYTAETEITGIGKRISKYNDIVENSPVDSSLMREYLANSKFQGKVIRITEYSIVYRIDGIMTATLGLHGQLGVSGKFLKN